MAMDQAMLEFAGKTQQVVLRIYQWSKPTLSLGYFQDFDGLDAIPGFRSLDCVRRMTGGGAILHDRELTYSLAFPDQVKVKGHSEALYRAVHQAVIEWLRELGFAANLWEDSNRRTDGTYSIKNSFLCFERRSEVDIVIDDQKIVGSAQRRVSEGLLQHGSLLLEASPMAPNLQGLFSQQTHESIEKVRHSVIASELGAVIQKSLRTSFDCNWTLSQANAEVHLRAEVIAKERFSRADWTQFKNG